MAKRKKKKRRKEIWAENLEVSEMEEVGSFRWAPKQRRLRPKTAGLLHLIVVLIQLIIIRSDILTATNTGEQSDLFFVTETSKKINHESQRYAQLATYFTPVQASQNRLNEHEAMAQMVNIIRVNSSHVKNSPKPNDMLIAGSAIVSRSINESRAGPEEKSVVDYRRFAKIVGPESKSLSPYLVKTTSTNVEDVPRLVAMSLQEIAMASTIPLASTTMPPKQPRPQQARQNLHEEARKTVREEETNLVKFGVARGKWWWWKCSISAS